MAKAWFVGALSALAFGAAEARELIPASVYGRLPEIADVAISPDGSKLAIARNAAATSTLMVLDANTLKLVTGATPSSAQTLRGVGWADEKLATFTVSETKFNLGVYKGNNRNIEFFRVGTLDIANSHMVLMLDKEGFSWADNSLAALQAPVAGDPGFGRMVSYGDSALRVYRVNLKSGQAVDSEPLPNDASDWLLNAQGKLIAHATTKERTNEWKLFSDPEKGPPIQLLQGVSITGGAPPLFGTLPDGRLVIRQEREEDAAKKLFAVNPADGALEALLAPDGFDVGGAISDPYTQVIVGGVYTDAFIPRQVFFEPDLELAYNTIQASFPNGYGHIVDWTRDRSTFVVYARTLEDAGAYYLFKPAQKKLLKIGAVYPDMPEGAVSPVQSITYKARDGVKVSGYLTIPVGQDPKGLPLIALVHGGPHSRDELDFDYFAQFLASRGYLVLQPNFRGSTGFGSKWFEAGLGQWGGLMQTDVEDGVATLIKAGFADPKRVCIMGASYGGYAAFAGATLTPDRYQCAISINGVADLELMLQRTLEQTDKQSGVYDWWTTSIGSLKDDREKLRAVSPVQHAEAVKAPILVVYSKDDSVVPNEQPLRMINRLREAGKDVTVAQLKGDDHWLSTWKGRTNLLETIDAFLQAKMGPNN